MRNILIILSIVFLASCASTNSKKENTATVENTPTKTPAATIDDKEIQWMTIEEAVAKQKENPKKIFVDAYTKWCGPCKLLDRKTFHNAHVAKYVNEHFYAVKFDAEGGAPLTFKGKVYKNPRYVAGKRGRNGVHELTQYWGVRAYPTMLFLDEEANVIMPATGYLKPQQLELYLKLVGQDDYKKIKSEEEWNAYQKAFVPTF